MESWLDEIKSQTHPNLKIFLIGNKADLENNRHVDKSLAEELVKEHNLDFFIETSAKTGLNAQEIFIKAAKVLFEDGKKYTENDLSLNPENAIPLKSEEENENANEDERRKKKCC